MIPKRLLAQPARGNLSQSNKRRAASTLEALRVFAENTSSSGEPADVVVIDLITNLLHLVDYLPAKCFGGVDSRRPLPSELLRVVTNHYTAETK
jgi:hypothetical protein